MNKKKKFNKTKATRYSYQHHSMKKYIPRLHFFLINDLWRYWLQIRCTMNTKMNQLLFYVKRQLKNRQFLYCKIWEFINFVSQKKKERFVMVMTLSAYKWRGYLDTLFSLLWQFSSRNSFLFVWSNPTNVILIKVHFIAEHSNVWSFLIIVERYFGFVGIGMYDW